jgi:hypothetical protein
MADKLVWPSFCPDCKRVTIHVIKIVADGLVDLCTGKYYGKDYELVNGKCGRRVQF